MGDRDVTFATGSRTLPRGASPDRARWGLDYYHAPKAGCGSRPIANAATAMGILRDVRVEVDEPVRYPQDRPRRPQLRLQREAGSGPWFPRAPRPGRARASNEGVRGLDSRSRCRGTVLSGRPWSETAS